MEANSGSSSSWIKDPEGKVIVVYRWKGIMFYRSLNPGMKMWDSTTQTMCEA